MTRLKTSDFLYDLPRAFIAQEPAPTRGASRLLVYHVGTGRVEHRKFADIGEYLCAPSLLVLNDTKVIPARLYGRKEHTSGRVELFLLKEARRGEWECLLKPSGRTRKGATIVFEGSTMIARVGERKTPDTWSIRFEGVMSVMDEIERIGHVPLPPYIKRGNIRSRILNRKSPDCVPTSGTPSGGQIPDPNGNLSYMDRERYQTVYARRPGAVAAPTAGLHFSNGLLEALERRGVQTVMMTLHVGLGSFRPVREEYISDHHLHEEYFEIGPDAAEAVNRARDEGRRIVVVGTTAARALETAADDHGRVRARGGWTGLFIYPPYRFRIIKNLLTNFHLPCSTLLMLVAALVGREKLLELYEIAKRERYRFYSYGDAMLVLNQGCR
jgi:S-adenosylmethionine:tRNA ribosyltransferase-isomerase